MLENLLKCIELQTYICYHIVTMKKVLIILATFLLLTACSPKEKEDAFVPTKAQLNEYWKNVSFYFEDLSRGEDAVSFIERAFEYENEWGIGTSTIVLFGSENSKECHDILPILADIMIENLDYYYFVEYIDIDLIKDDPNYNEHTFDIVLERCKPWLEEAGISDTIPVPMLVVTKADGAKQNIVACHIGTLEGYNAELIEHQTELKRQLEDVLSNHYVFSK